MAELKYMWGKKIEPYMQYEQMKVYYTKNNKDQNAVLMNFGNSKTPNYKVVEDSHYARNGLNANERAELSAKLNAGEIWIPKVK